MLLNCSVILKKKKVNTTVYMCDNKALFFFGVASNKEKMCITHMLFFSELLLEKEVMSFLIG